MYTMNNILKRLFKVRHLMKLNIPTALPGTCIATSSSTHFVEITVPSLLHQTSMLNLLFKLFSKRDLNEDQLQVCKVSFILCDSVQVNFASRIHGNIQDHNIRSEPRASASKVMSCKGNTNKPVCKVIRSYPITLVDLYDFVQVN